MRNSDSDALLRATIGGLVGAVIGVIVASLALSAYGVASRGLSWVDLSNMATFWNGHLSAIVILLVALGLYLQARQLEIQIGAEQAQLARHRYEFLRTSLEMLATRMVDLGENLRAYHVSGAENPIKIRAFAGVPQFVSAVLAENPDRSDDVEVWVEPAPLNAYARASEQVERVCKALLECDPSEQLPAVYRFLTDRRIHVYAEQLQKKQLALLDKLGTACNDKADIARLAEMLEQGWYITDYNHSGRFYLKARRLAPAFGRIDHLGADDCPSLEDACKMLVRKWVNQFG